MTLLSYREDSLIFLSPCSITGTQTVWFANSWAQWKWCVSDTDVLWARGFGRSVYLKKNNSSMYAMKLWTTFGSYGLSQLPGKICDLKWASFWLNINAGVTYLHTCLYMLINISHHIMLLMSQLHAPIFNTYNTCTKHIRWYILLHVNT